MTTDEFNDIASAIMRLRKAFMRNRLDPPTIIQLASWEDGQTLSMIAGKEALSTRVLVEQGLTGEAAYQMTICGTKVRWPAKRKALRNGVFQFI